MITNICVSVALCEIAIAELHSCSVRIGGRVGFVRARADHHQFLVGGCFVPLRLRTRLRGTGWGRVRADALAESVRCHAADATAMAAASSSAGEDEGVCTIM